MPDMVFAGLRAQSSGRAEYYPIALRRSPRAASLHGIFGEMRSLKQSQRCYRANSVPFRCKIGR
jgi:hypothetical protein